MKRARSGEDTSVARIRATLQRLASLRGAAATFCPSEAARALTSSWRPLMPQIRSVALDMIAEGALEATQRGVVVEGSILAVRGPIRLRAPRGGVK